MYTFNLFIFGHDITKDERLYDKMRELDVEFSQTLDEQHEFEVQSHYHGGMLGGQPYSFGIVITDDDGNKDYVNTVRNARDEDYLEKYNRGLNSLFGSLEQDRGAEEEFDRFIDDLKEFTSKNKPTFYTMEASS